MVSDSCEQVLIAANPKSGRTSSHTKVAQLHSALIQRGFHCEVLHDLAAVLAKSTQLHAAGHLKAVVSAGGDGTAGALANLLPAHIPILLFPLGTENLLAKHLGLTGDIEQACETLVHGQTFAMDVGSANGKLFLVMLSCGFDAEVVRQMHATRRGHISRWSYAKPILSALRAYRFPQLPFQLNDDPATQRNAAWIYLFNVPRYAAALDFCPQADPCDGQLDVCTFQRSGVAFGLGYLARLFLKSHQSMRGFRHARCRKLVIELPPTVSRKPIRDIPYQIDGDPGGILPLQIELLPERLLLFQPVGKP